MSAESHQHHAALDQSYLDPPGVGQFPSGSSSNTVLHPPGTPDEPWSQKYVLCFEDGGGIRGYSSLLIIEELMKIISTIETRHSPNVTSSYHPEDFIPSKGYLGDSLSMPTVRYLPAHYFDYIAGTSTGGLIAIMLSRLRMNTHDCILEYEAMGEKVFGKPRIFSWSGHIFWPRERFSHRRFEEVIESVITRRTTVAHRGLTPHMFPSDENRCRTIVMAVRENTTGKGAYMFRSYQHLPFQDSIQIELNPGPAQNVPTCKAARATSAAPTYFKEVEIGEVMFLDGGFGAANNPSQFAWEEVRQMSGNNENAIALTVSIGTGQPRDQLNIKGHQFISKLGAYLRWTTHITTDAEVTHSTMVSIHHASPTRYHRLNVQNGLQDIKLGEWKTTRSETGVERVTLNRIREATRAYLDKPDVDKQLHDIAKILVHNRRARSITPRWINVATGHEYHCTIKGCFQRATCHVSVEGLRQHMIVDHGLGNETPEERETLRQLVNSGKILPSE